MKQTSNHTWRDAWSLSQEFIVQILQLNSCWRCILGGLSTYVNVQQIITKQLEIFITINAKYSNIFRKMTSHYLLHKKVFQTDSYMLFDKYVLRDIEYSRKEKMRLFHSRSPATVKVYSKIMKRFVRFSRKQRSEPYPLTELSVLESLLTHWT